LTETPKFFFILTLAYSGSTALAKILNTAPRSMILTPKAEGQRLVRQLRGKNRWSANKPVDWETVRQVWLDRYRQVNELVETVDVVIEKSPPHLVRAEQLAAQFTRSVSMVFNRDPYAHCASHLHHHNTPEELGSEARVEIHQKNAEKWAARSALLAHQARSRRLLMFTYEQFCAAPHRWVSEAIRICPELDGANADAVIRVKDYPPQGIVNQNPRQLAWLRDEDRAAISSALREHSDLLKFFGYELR
jgi:hypothetical protein